MIKAVKLDFFQKFYMIYLNFMGANNGKQKNTIIFYTLKLSDKLSYELIVLIIKSNLLIFGVYLELLALFFNLERLPLGKLDNLFFHKVHIHKI